MFFFCLDLKLNYVTAYSVTVLVSASLGVVIYRGEGGGCNTATLISGVREYIAKSHDVHVPSTGSLSIYCKVQLKCNTIASDKNC